MDDTVKFIQAQAMLLSDSCEPLLFRPKEKCSLFTIILHPNVCEKKIGYLFCPLVDSRLWGRVCLHEEEVTDMHYTRPTCPTKKFQIQLSLL